MTESELRALVCRTAEDWLGLRESDGGHLTILAHYNAIEPLPRGYRMRADDPWCAAFVSALGQRLGLTDTLLPECGCEPMIALYRARGLWREDEDFTPRPGDLVFYDWQDPGGGDCRGAADHVGLVIACEGGRLRTIEGNVSDSVAERSLARNGRYLRGFALPDYAAASRRLSADATPSQPSPLGGRWPEGPDEGRPAGAMEDEHPVDPAASVILSEAKDPSPDPAPSPSGPSASPERGGGCEAAGGVSPASDAVTVVLPLLRPGAAGETVRTLQLLLIGRGFPCGPDGADGDFGANTAAALRRFQRSRGLVADAEAGPATWPAILGVN